MEVVVVWRLADVFGLVEDVGDVELAGEVAVVLPPG